MDTALLRAHVGDDLYEEACRWAWATAAGTGRLPDRNEDASWPAEVVNVPHELEERIWDSEGLSWRGRVELMLAFYGEMPCYATFMYADHHLRSFDRVAREALWSGVRDLLDEDDERLADPVAYWLWCGPFEVPREVAEAWREVTRPPTTDRRLQRVLHMSGPVPYELKRSLYDELEREERWHPWIFDGLVGSVFDYFGKVDKRDARKRLTRLHVPDAGEVLVKLQTELGDP